MPEYAEDTEYPTISIETPLSVILMNFHGTGVCSIDIKPFVSEEDCKKIVDYQGTIEYGDKNSVFNLCERVTNNVTTYFIQTEDESRSFTVDDTFLSKYDEYCCYDNYW